MGLAERKKRRSCNVLYLCPIYRGVRKNKIQIQGNDNRHCYMTLSQDPSLSGELIGTTGALATRFPANVIRDNETISIVLTLDSLTPVNWMRAVLC